MKRRLRNGVREKSRAAVAVAGTRERRNPVRSAGTWGPPGRRVDGPWRPGKTARERRHG